MIAEIPASRIPAYAARFPGPHLELVMASIAAGNSAAQLWEARQPAESAVALLWDKGNNVFYFSGNHIGPAAQRAFAELIATDIRPRALAERSRYFKTHVVSSALEGALAAMFRGIALHEMPTLFYGCRQSKPTHVAAPSVEAIRFVPIDRAFLAAGQFENIEQVRAEIRWMWPSEERFCAYGLGCAAVVQQQIVCWCTAEYMSAKRCGIGIETIQAYQRRGVATATAAQFVQLCFERGIAPSWECRANNTGSIRVAEKVGFSLLSDERYWAGEFVDYRNLQNN